MQLILCGRGLIPTPSLRALLERKLAKFARIRPRILEARVTLGAEKFRRTARLVLHARRRTFTAVVTASDLLTAVDDGVDVLSRQVSEDKRRRRARLHAPPRVA